MTPNLERRGRSNWLAGLTVGVGAGVLALILPVIGWAIVLAFVLLLVRAGQRMNAFAGLFIGIGVTWVALLIRSHLDCQAFNSKPGQGCVEPDIGPLLAIGIGILAIGLAATAAVLIRRSRPG